MSDEDKLWIKKARRYLGAWQKSYGLDVNQADKIVKALSRALKRENLNGRRLEINRRMDIFGK